MEFLMNPFLIPDSSPWPCNSAMNFGYPAYRRPANTFGFEPMWMENPLSASQPCQGQYLWRENPRYHPVYHDEPSDDDGSDDSDDDDDVSRSQRRCSSLPTHYSRFSHPFQQSQVNKGHGQPFHNGQCPQQFKFHQRGQRNSCNGRNNSELVHPTRQPNKTRPNQSVKSKDRRSSKRPQQSNMRDNLSNDRFNENTHDRMDVRSSSNASGRDCNSERPVGVVEPIVNEVQQNSEKGKESDQGKMKTDADSIQSENKDIEQTSNKNSTSDITRSAENSGAVDRLNAAEKELAVIEERLIVFSGTRKDKEFIILDELITKLLLSLDAVESNGDESIRCKRKELVVRAQSCSDWLEKKSGGSAGEGRVRGGDEDGKKDKEEQEMETIEDELRETFMGEL